MHLLNTPIHFPGLPLIVVAEGEFQIVLQTVTYSNICKGEEPVLLTESCLFAFRLNGFKDASDNKTLSSGKIGLYL